MNLLPLIFLTLFSSLTSTGPKTNIGEKIGYIKNDSYIITMDTIRHKDFLEKNIIDVPEGKLSKIEILKSKTVGERSEDYYMLIAYDKKLNLKTAHWLVRDADSLYFFENKTKKDIANEVFFGTFFTCHSSEADCFPRVRYYNNEYSWGTSDVLACNPDSPCKSSSAYLYEE